MKVVISSGHSKYVSGANGIINEVGEARRVVPKVCEYLKSLGVSVTEFHDDTSKTQAANLNTIVGFHNSQVRDLDISVHFNAASSTDAPRGTEVLYYTEQGLAAKISKAIADASGLKDRGAKKRTDLAFLANTSKPAVLIEVCFVDSSADTKAYQSKFDEICKAIGEAVSGKKLPLQASGNSEKDGGDDESMEKRFNSISEIPDYAKPTIKKLIDSGFLTGSGTGLNLSEDMVRIFVVLDRAGVYDKLSAELG